MSYVMLYRCVVSLELGIENIIIFKRNLTANDMHEDHVKHKMPTLGWQT